MNKVFRFLFNIFLIIILSSCECIPYQEGVHIEDNFPVVINPEEVIIVGVDNYKC